MAAKNLTFCHMKTPEFQGLRCFFFTKDILLDKPTIISAEPMLYQQGDQRTFMNIGLLEDNPAILDYMTLALEMAGHQVQTYTYGASLIESLLTGSDAHSPLPYDLIIVDLLLPGNISGYETIKQIQEVIPLNKLPVIIISAGSRDEIEFIKTNLPTVPVLRKPFRMSALFQLIYDLKIG